MLAGATVLALTADGSQAVGEKDITLYLHNSTVSVDIGDVVTFRVLDTIQGTDGLSKTAPAILAVHNDWYLYPAMAEDVTVSGKVSMYIWATRTPRMGDSTQATMTFDLFEIDGSGAKVAKFAHGTTNVDMLNDWKQYIITNNSVANHTVPEGHYMLLEYELHGSSSNYYQLAWGDYDYRSKLVVACQDYLVMGSVGVLDSAGARVTELEFDAPDKRVTFHATVNDPFGGYDVRFANVTLVGPTGATIIGGVGMARVGGYFTSFVTTFERAWDYTGRPSGAYELTVSSVDNSGWYYRFPARPDDTTYGGHLESMTVKFWIGGPPQPVTVTVLDNLTRPLAGALVDVGGRAVLTGTDGNASVMVPNATYDLLVTWEDVPVHEGTVTVLGITHVTVRAAVYDPEFIVVDDHDAPVEGVVALIGHPNGTVLDTFMATDAAGTFAMVRAPGGEYRITLIWLGSGVLERGLTVDGNGPYTLACRVHTLDISVEDDLGGSLEMALVVIANTTTHLVLDATMTGLDGNTSSRLPAGAYDITVLWRDALVHSTTIGFVLNESTLIVLRADVFTLDLTVVDTAGMPLPDVRVVVTTPEGDHVLSFGATDAEGNLAVRLPPGSFTMLSYWHDVLVNSTTPLVVDGGGDVAIVGSVHWVRVVVLDPRGEPLVAARVSLDHSAGSSFGSQTTGASGEATFRLPVGDYRATVVWYDVPVLDANVSVVSGDDIVLVAYVYYIEARVTDSRGAAVQDALVRATIALTGRGAGDGMTDIAGTATLRLPIGQSVLAVSWQGSPVYEGTIDVQADAQVNLTVAVFYVTFHTTDSQGLDLATAFVTVANTTTGRPMGGLVTDDGGLGTLRLPLGVYSTSVVWQDHEVHDGVVEVDADAIVDIACSVHHVTFCATDADGAVLEGALVTVAAVPGDDPMGARVTAADGMTVLRLPAGTFRVTVAWRDVVVMEIPITVTSDTDIVLETAVYTAVLHVVDSRGVDLSDAQISLALARNAAAMGAGVTATDGTVSFKLPVGTYRVTVRSMDTEVLLSIVDVAASGPIEVTARVFYLSLHVVDAADEDLAGATVTVLNRTTGLVLGTGLTDANGSLDMRLPHGPLRVDTVWGSVLVGSTSAIDLVGDAAHALEVRVYYLTVEVRDAEGARVPHADLCVVRGGVVVTSASTDAAGSAVFRLPANLYTVNMTLRTTYLMTFIDVSKTTDVELNGSMSVRFDLDRSDYPLPLHRTVLFAVVVAFVVTVVALLLLAYLMVRRERGRAPTLRDEANEDDIDGVDPLVEDSNGSGAGGSVVALNGRGVLKDLVGEGEIEADEK